MKCPCISEEIANGLLHEKLISASSPQASATWHLAVVSARDEVHVHLRSGEGEVEGFSNFELKSSTEGGDFEGIDYKLAEGEVGIYRYAQLD